MCPVFARMCPLFGQMCPVCVRMCPVGVDDAFAPSAPARRFRGGIGVEVRRVSVRRWSTKALASGDDVRVRGVHGVGGEVFSFCPEVFSFRANVFSFCRFPPPMCSISRPMCSVGVDDSSARAAPARRFVGGFGVKIRRVSARRRSATDSAWGNTESLQTEVIRSPPRDYASPSHPQRHHRRPPHHPRRRRHPLAPPAILIRPERLLPPTRWIP